MSRPHAGVADRADLLHAPYDHDEARIQLMDDFRALGIPRLDAEDIPTAIRLAERRSNAPAVALTRTKTLGFNEFS